MEFNEKIQKKLEEFYKYITTEIRDLEEVENSEGFKIFTLPSIVPWYNNELWIGMKFIISGNVDEIKIGNMNKTSILVTYSLKSDLLRKKQTAIITVPVELEDFVRANIKTTTGIKLVCKPVRSDYGNIFELVEVLEYNTPLKFGYYICNKDNPDENSDSDVCGFNLGYNTNEFETDSCPMCGSSLRYVVDVYKKGAT